MATSPTKLESTVTNFRRKVSRSRKRDATSRFGNDRAAATWALLPSLALTLVGFFQPLGVWHQRIRRLTVIIGLSLCAIIFMADVGYFAEYDNQFDHWIFGLIYDDRAAIFETIWKS